MRSLTLDAKRKGKMTPNLSAERDFFKAIKSVSAEAAKIVKQYTEGATIKNPIEMQRRLDAYAKQIGPWAVEQSAKLLQRVQKSNAKAYKEQSKIMGNAIKAGFIEQETGKVGLALLHEQVALIQSLPVEAGLRAQRIAAKNFAEGMRATPDPSVIKELQEEMGMTEQVAVNRARLIARTETARANASFVQARAVALGVTHYVWRTTMDGAERHSHARMNGKTIAYDKPPKLSDGTVGHAGTFPNCRCYQDPVLPDDY